MDREALGADIDATGAFGRVRHEMIHWTGRHSPRELRALFASPSPWLDVAPTLRRTRQNDVESLAAGTFAGRSNAPTAPRSTLPSVGGEDRSAVRRTWLGPVEGPYPVHPGAG